MLCRPGEAGVPCRPGVPGVPGRFGQSGPLAVMGCRPAFAPLGALDVPGFLGCPEVPTCRDLGLAWLSGRFRCPWGVLGSKPCRLVNVCEPTRDACITVVQRKLDLPGELGTVMRVVPHEVGRGLRGQETMQCIYAHEMCWAHPELQPGQATVIEPMEGALRREPNAPVKPIGPTPIAGSIDSLIRALLAHRLDIRGRRHAGSRDVANAYASGVDDMLIHAVMVAYGWDEDTSADWVAEELADMHADSAH